MLLTITTTYQPATDLGYLLHKHPERAQSFALSFGQAHVFYPEASVERCTAALLLDIDPVQLSRGQRGATPLEPYVNDRPYVASSFLSVAISDVFGTALNGHSAARKELAETKIPLRAKLTTLPCRGGEGLLKRLFEPLGYSVTAEGHLLDEKYPDWGKSPYYTVTLDATCRLSDLLTHLYVLIPVLDDDKHYWIGKDEIEKLLQRGKGWLETHPEREQIAFRYLKHSRSLTRAAIARLVIEESSDEDESEEEADWLNRTINIDTGCVFGGKLTALRYPEKELVSVPALRTYWEPAKPFLVPAEQAPTLTAQQRHDDVLDIKDVSGKLLISTRLQQHITIREENTIAALEVMSRYAANPKWLIYLPPTMSPTETSKEPGLLEHPAEAFAYFLNQGVPVVVCEEKHMGSRAVVIVCRDQQAARKTFGITNEGSGICYTRTGRRFFDDAALEAEMLARVRAALTATNFWETFQTDWVCLDCELMPWSVKAQALLLQQYAAVGAAASAALDEAVTLLEQSAAHGVDVAPLLASFGQRRSLAAQYIAAYQHYCWPVNSVADLKLAPFHILASEGQVHTGKNHIWHMETLAEICKADAELLLATPCKVVDVTDTTSTASAIEWWQELTVRGGEGMVVKPLDFIVRGKRGLVQPALKCRGAEYLRIIYGPEYSIPANLSRLRSRSVGAKRSLALREFSLGIEALERFTRHEPLRAVHECVFGVLALESEPVDPRL